MGATELITEITKQKFIELYERRLTYDTINVTVNGEQRIYSRITANRDEPEMVIYVVL